MSLAAVAEPPADHAAQIEQWHSERVARLHKPDGWLSLVGLHWIDEGRFTLGRADSNAIVLNTGPAVLGEIERHGEHVVLRPAADAGVEFEPPAAVNAVELKADSSGTPTVVRFNGGTASFILIERSGRYALRVRDSQAPNLLGFTRIERYPVAADWRMDARWKPHPPGKTLEIASVINTLEPMPNPGAIEFDLQGKTHTLEVVDEGDGALFVIFADRTNGKETYGAGRFVYAEPAQGDRVVLDFNKAYNPPCALNAYSTCPLPPPENRLDLAVTAGEKKYTGPHD